MLEGDEDTRRVRITLLFIGAEVVVARWPNGRERDTSLRGRNWRRVEAADGGLMKAQPWPWQVPGGSFYAWDGAYELAHAAPARARAGGERDGEVTYLIAARVRDVTRGEGQIAMGVSPAVALVR